MSTLQESLLSRRPSLAALEQLCYSSKSPSTSVSVRCVDGQSWTFPWTHFVFAHHRNEEKSEKLILTFTSHEVLLRGKNLSKVEEEAANLRLDKLQVAAAKYSISDSEVTIESIRVRPLDGSKSEDGDLTGQSAGIG